MRFARQWFLPVRLGSPWRVFPWRLLPVPKKMCELLRCLSVTSALGFGIRGRFHFPSAVSNAARKHSRACSAAMQAFMAEKV